MWNFLILTTMLSFLTKYILLFDVSLMLLVYVENLNILLFFTNHFHVSPLYIADLYAFSPLNLSNK